MSKGFFKRLVKYIDVKTYNVELNFKNDSDRRSLLETLELHNQAFQIVVDWLFDNDLKTSQAKLVHDGTYRDIRAKVIGLPSQLCIKARMEAMSTIKTLKALAKTKKKPITRPIKTKLSMRLDDRVFSMREDGVRLTTKDGRIDCSLKWYPKVKEMFKSYAMCDPLVFERNGRFFLAMTFDDPKPTWVPNSCLGVDLGLRRLATTSEGIIFQDKELLKIKRRIRFNRTNLRRKMAIVKSKSAARKIKRVSKKEQNFTKQHIHKLCNGILKSTNSNTIVLEDLSGIKSKSKGKKFNSRLAQVPFFQTKTILTYKAQTLGKRVETVNPAYTSKDDYRGVERGKRQGCRYYASDGVVLDADHNAAVNIAKRWTIQNELPVSFKVPLDGTQTLWAGCCQSAECRDAPSTLSKTA
jgi:IS605 OrfB family transposase